AVERTECGTRGIAGLDGGRTRDSSFRSPDGVDWRAGCVGEKSRPLEIRPADTADLRRDSATAGVDPETGWFRIAFAASVGNDGNYSTGNYRPLESAHERLGRRTEIQGAGKTGMAGTVCRVEDYPARRKQEKRRGGGVGRRNVRGTGSARAVGSFALLRIA